MKSIDRMFYSQFGRIVHAFWGIPVAGYGPYVMDDFGNSIKVTNAPILHFIRQAA